MTAELKSRARRLARALWVSGVVLFASGGCRFSPYRFAGGGLPGNIRTVAILPFDNQTSTPDLQRDLFDAMRGSLQSRLNLRDASESRADAIVRGSIVKYDIDVPIGFSADPRQNASTRRQLQLVIDVAIIDQASGRTLLERKGLAAKGEYAERDERGGRRQAITKLVNDIVEGAQSQW